MLYIVTALKPEAQAFVDYYKLQKAKLNNFTLYKNEKITLIISGLGVINARLATQTLINHFDITDEDIYINIGICGASTSFTLGELLEIGSVEYKEIVYKFDAKKHHITCLDVEAKTENYNIVDMESYGFYDAVIHNPAIQSFHILKVVSDHFEPHKITKEQTKSLIFQNIKNLMQHFDFAS